ncbi:hypothetical protein BLOT_015099 [Blomia tropicalis]|nr:hypothetical protein BLOT_015099 [Blomia tropicalis]
MYCLSENIRNIVNSAHLNKFNTSVFGYQDFHSSSKTKASVPSSTIANVNSIMPLCTHPRSHIPFCHTTIQHNTIRQVSFGNAKLKFLFRHILDILLFAICLEEMILTSFDLFCAPTPSSQSVHYIHLLLSFHYLGVNSRLDNELKHFTLFN